VNRDTIECEHVCTSHCSRGYVTSGTTDNIWRIWWPSDKRSTARPSKLQYHSLNVWGTFEESSQLLKIIASVPHRSPEQADEVIRPYIQVCHVKQGGRSRRIITNHSALTPQATKRYLIERDYWRVRLLDTLEEYRRLGDDDD
jgi:hypothetical protein